MQCEHHTFLLAKHTKKLLEFSTIINSSLEIEEIRKKAALAIMGLVNCEAASLLLYDENSQELYFDVALGEKADKVKTIRLKLGQGIAGWVAKNKEALIINDVQNDPRFFKGADEKSGFKTKSMLSLPVLIREKLLGVIQAINKKMTFLIIMILSYLRHLAVRSL